MREARTFGDITNGTLSIYRKEQFISSISMMQGKAEKVRVELICKKIYNKRSVNQNAYYWGYLIKEFCRGYLDLNGEPISAEEAHDFLKSEFNYSEIINEKSGEIKRIGKSTTSKTTVEFMEYCDQCGRFISEWFGIPILEPSEQSQIMFK